MRQIVMADTEVEIRDWLISYAWMGDEDTKRRVVECIMTQDDWKFIDGRTEHLAAQAEDPGPAEWAQAHGFALSALYECHNGPHIETCPEARAGS